MSWSRRRIQPGDLTRRCGRNRFCNVCGKRDALLIRFSRRAWVARGGLTKLSYCLSYTAVFLTFFPFGSVPLVLTVRVLPSADTTILPVTVVLPSFFPVSSK